MAVPFGDFRRMLEAAGYTLKKIYADRRIFTRAGFPSINVEVNNKHVNEEEHRAIGGFLKAKGLLPPNYRV